MSVLVRILGPNLTAVDILPDLVRERDLLDVADDLRAIERQTAALYRIFRAAYDVEADSAATLRRHAPALRELHERLGRLVWEAGDG